MRIAIVADLHANLEAVQAVFREIDKHRPDKVFCLGDLTGYNANPNEVIDIIRERDIPTIMGNHDAAVCGLEDPWFFRASAKEAIEWQFEQVRDEHKQWVVQGPGTNRLQPDLPGSARLAEQSRRLYHRLARCHASAGISKWPRRWMCASSGIVIGPRFSRKRGIRRLSTPRVSNS